jgi:flavin-binding protein dodecin
MPDSMYKVIELIGSSTTSWEDAAKTAVVEAGKHLTDLRVAEIDELDLKMEGGKMIYRTKLHVSFRYHPSEEK